MVPTHSNPGSANCLKARNVKLEGDIGGFGFKTDFNIDAIIVDREMEFPFSGMVELKRKIGFVNTGVKFRMQTEIADIITWYINNKVLKDMKILDKRQPPKRHPGMTRSRDDVFNVMLLKREF